MTQYESTSGHVIAAKIGIGQSVSNSESGQASSLKKMYYPAVTYEYIVGDKTYQNNCFWEEDNQRRIQIAEQGKIEPLVAQYAEGDQVTVYYDPYKPNHSYLHTLPEVNFNKKLWAIGIGAIIFVGIALCVFFLLQS